MKTEAIMTNLFKKELGTELYDEVVELVYNRQNSEAFISFDKNKLSAIESVFRKYSDTDNSLQLFHIFLSCHERHSGQQNILNNINKDIDVTESFGYTDLVADLSPIGIL